MAQPSTAVLSIAYLPPIQYFCKLMQFNRILIENDEHYNKQSYRNRFRILTSNGIQTLSVPVHKQHGHKVKIKEVRIDHTKDWQRNHWRAIESAYSSSPFFEFYKDDLWPFFETKYTFLFDYDMDLIHLLLELLEVSVQIEYTDQFYPHYYDPYIDYRQSIHPKRRMQTPDTLFQPVEYHQVFSDRFSFVPNLSILDLLMNEGPETKHILSRSTCGSS